MISSPLVLIATSDAFPALHPADQPLIPALRGRGVEARPAVWTDAGIDWSAARLVLIRSTWDYFVRYDEFRTWVDRVAAVSELVNPPSLVLWNAHKGYLKDLAERGVPVVDTVYVSRGDPADLKPILDAHGWAEAVLKPAVSGNARGTFRVKAEQLAEGGQVLRQLLAEGDALVQPYLTSVGIEGEVAAIFLDGELSHGVSRPSMLDHGVTASDGSQRRSLSPEELAFGRKVVRAVAPLPLYARVDMVRANDGSLRLLELEIIEPSLVLSLAPDALERLADVVAHRAKSNVG